ncbi:OmpH family outer membrane protein [Mucilaginibacter psychrotolerans]|uniref:OmpH family outer membrane protein n=1 Tax=Mucilaginibacter psychrotolerans TaxID=1524096 RepID=A0A4Y8SEA7_9SPHI|nr:OmpH family outer membrane protein [Mucilaginibacter psychrotolerans]TFF36897.1 OmpH family outer membrane protein [Mucilaginibacter psychrotolerans]
MKIKASIVTKSVLVIAIAAGLAACNQNKTADKPAAAPASTVTGTPEIVYINQDSLVSQYDYIKDMNKRLEEKGKAANNEVELRKQAIQRQYADYQKNGATIPADKRAAIEQRLQQKGQEFQQFQQNAGAQVQQEQLTETNKLYENLVEFTKKYAKEKGYKMVLTFQKGNTTMLYGDASLDVTKDVIKRLNDAYAKDKK